MASSLLQDAMPPPPPDAPSSARFRPYASTKHTVSKARYITSNDPRGYLPVYEYPLNGQWLMVDSDNGYVLWTGIWKALGNSKADIVKMVDSQPELASQIRRVRGGYLKIQGTWMPYEIALRLARRVAWPIREDLIPLFGPTFPSTCLSPDQPGYGQLLSNPGRRKSRRTISVSARQPGPSHAQSTTTPSQSPAGFSEPGIMDAPPQAAAAARDDSGMHSQAYPGNHNPHTQYVTSASAYMRAYQFRNTTQTQFESPNHPHSQCEGQIQSHNTDQRGSHSRPPTPSHAEHGYAFPPPPTSQSSQSPHMLTQGYATHSQRERGFTARQPQQRYAPYPSGPEISHSQKFSTPSPNPGPYTPTPSHAHSYSYSHGTSPWPTPPESHATQSMQPPTHRPSADYEHIQLPPLASLTIPPSGRPLPSSPFSLPPISSLDSPGSGGSVPDVLRRLKMDDERTYSHHHTETREMNERDFTRARGAYDETRTSMENIHDLRRRRSFSAPPFNPHGGIGSAADVPPSAWSRESTRDTTYSSGHQGREDRGSGYARTLQQQQMHSNIYQQPHPSSYPPPAQCTHSAQLQPDSSLTSPSRSRLESNTRYPYGHVRPRADEPPAYLHPGEHVTPRFPPHRPSRPW